MGIKVEHIFEHARKNGYAIGAFNVANLETLKAVVQAAKKLNSPAIIEASSSEIDYIGITQLRSLVDSYLLDTELPILLNLDHAIKEESIQQAIDAGFDLIHVDASTLPYDENVALTKKFAAQCHQLGLICEGELNHIQGSSDDHRNTDVSTVQLTDLYTDPDEAAKFVSDTGIDTFAVFIGNVHGMYAQPPKLDLDLLARIREKVSCYFSLHGGSGILDEEVKDAIRIGGIVKVNVNSEMRIAFRESLEKSLADNKSVKSYEYYEPVIAAVQSIVEQKMNVFGSVGKADSLRDYVLQFADEGDSLTLSGE